MVARNKRKHVDMVELARQKGLAEGQEMNCLHRVTRNGVWLGSISHRINGMELSREKIWDNLCLRYRLMPQDIPVTCDGCGKKLLIENALS